MYGLFSDVLQMYYRAGTSFNLCKVLSYRGLPYAESLWLTVFRVEISPQSVLELKIKTLLFYTYMSNSLLPTDGHTEHKCAWCKQQSLWRCFTCQIKGACQEFP